MKLSKLIERLEEVKDLMHDADPDVTAGEGFAESNDIGLVSIVFPGDEEKPAVLLSTDSL